ncbi:urease accessory protein UreD [Flavobacterium sp. 245]|uniref:urease accessory protein UreD n=1 Tax=Flavobacterium sp. 245 TaxID=2512115 RepID=UPI00105FC529|nr:urease accessory protein UreD [Flavobacterium sp. 245]TDO94928.1 urease accessory protein [Flavobacterium sp. 245]
MINRLNIVSGFKDGRSYLKDNFFTRPFRIANINEDRSDPSLYLMLMSSSPGILDNDHYDINIEVESESRLQLQSQSYQRLFNMKNGAQQQMKVSLSNESTFSYIQHPIVPHEQSIFKAHNVIALQGNCSLTLGEIITCGRKHSGEVFLFSKFQNLTEVFHNGKLILKDNVLLQPLLADIETLGQMEGFTHQATLIHINTGIQDMKSLIEDTFTLLQSQENVAYGVSQPFANGMIVRMLGNGGEQLYNAFRQIEDKLWNMEKQVKVENQIIESVENYN